MTAHSDRARRARGRRGAAVAGALVLVLAGLGFANASTLTINGGTVSAAQAGPCTDAANPITLTQDGFILYGGVVLSGLPASCRGKAVEVSAASNQIRGSVPAGAPLGSDTVYVDTSDYWLPRTFTVLIDGWVVPTT